jgi:hypothetical protein
MNKLLVLNWLLHDANEYADDFYGAISESRRDVPLEEALRELNNWRNITLPPSLPNYLDCPPSSWHRPRACGSIHWTGIGRHWSSKFHSASSRNNKKKSSEIRF